MPLRPLPGSLTMTLQPAERVVHGPTVQVFWRPGCPYCARLRRALSRGGVGASWRNIWADPAAAQLVRRATGGDETVPTVVVAGRCYVNPAPRHLLSVIAELTPQTGPDSHGGRPRTAGVIAKTRSRWRRRPVGR